jgi:hypothetical protein
VNKREVKITGSYAALAQAVAGNLGDSMGVPRFAPKWLPDQGSNLGPADYSAVHNIGYNSGTNGCDVGRR